MNVRYKGNTIIYTKGATKEDVINCLEKRMQKREVEMAKREWIVKEYRSLEAKQAEDRSWLAWVRTSWDVSKENDHVQD